MKRRGPALAVIHTIGRYHSSIRLLFFVLAFFRSGSPGLVAFGPLLGGCFASSASPASGGGSHSLRGWRNGCRGFAICGGMVVRDTGDVL